MDVENDHELARELGNALAAASIPGAAMGVLSNGKAHVAAAGVLDIESGREATPQSVFQTGSIVKVMTATLIMQLRDQGRLRLDDPIGKYLPALRGGALADIRIRHLLTHTGGLLGDFFEPTTEDEDCVARFVELCANLAPLYPAGALAAYSNTGFVFLGAVAEAITGKPWDDLLAEKILTPLGMIHSFSRRKDLSKFRATRGHVLSGGRMAAVPVDQMFMPRSNSPGGTTLWSTVGDLLLFAESMMSDASPLLKRSSLEEMQTPQAACPRLMGECAYGYAWFIRQADGVKILSHAGGTIGQTSLLLAIPERNFALALLTNAGSGAPALTGLVNDVVRQWTKVATPPPPAFKANTLVIKDFSHYEGTYGAGKVSFQVHADDNRLVVDFDNVARSDGIASGRALLTPVDESIFLSQPADGVGPAGTVEFISLADSQGKPDILYGMGRAYRRVDT